MNDWYYHDPGAGRVGPFSASTLRERFRDRQIESDTLVWCEGMREWMPLRMLAVELDLDSVTPDTTRPPPLPPRVAPMPTTPAMRATQASSAQPEKRMSGCLLALIIGAVAFVVLVGILAAIALPAYHDYVERAKKAAAAAPPAFDADAMAESDGKVRTLLQRAMSTYYLKNGYCPDTFELESVEVRDSGLSGYYTTNLREAGEQRCTYDVAFLRQGPQLDGKSFRYEVTLSPDGDAQVRCSAPDLPPSLRPPQCN
ncbi:GYF domain-containing protein [Lysobacter fragariae]